MRVIQLAVSLLAFVPLSLYFEGSQWRESRVKWRGELVAAGGEKVTKEMLLEYQGQIKAPFLYLIKEGGRETESECDRGKEKDGERERDSGVQRSERGGFVKLNISSCIQKDLSSHHLYLTKNRKSYHPD